MELRDYIKILKRKKIPIIIVAILIFSVYLVIIYMKPKYYIASSKIMIRFYTFEERVLPGAFSAAALNLPVDSQLQLMATREVRERVREKIKKELKVIVTPEEVGRTTFYRIGTTNTIQIDAKTTDAVKSVLIANVFAEVSIERNRELSEENYVNANKYIITQLTEYKNKLKEAEGKIAEFNKKYGVMNFDQELISKIERLAEYQFRLEELKNKIAEAEILTNKLKEEIRKEDKFIILPEIIPNPKLEEYRRQLVPLEIQLLELSEQYQDAHPKIIALKRKIEALERRIRKDITRYVEVPTRYPNPYYNHLIQQLLQQSIDRIAYNVRKKTLEEIIKKEKGEIVTLSNGQLHYAHLLREKMTIEKLYDNLHTVKEQMHVSSILKGGNAQLVENATEDTVVPTTKTSPHHITFVILISIVCGIGFGIVLELLDDIVRTPHQVRRYLNLPVYGNVPHIEEKEEKLLTTTPMKFPLSEVYQKICFQIEKVCFDSGVKAFLITSANSQEGKSTIATNLAISLARGGERVLLVDGDLRRPLLHRFFNATNTVGLTSLLTGEVKEQDIDKILINTNIEGMHLLPSGPMSINPIGLLKSEKTKRIIDYIKSKHEMIIFDSPPLNVVIDGTISASYLDGVILVIDASKTKRKEVLHAKQLLTSLKCRILGAILNNLTMEEGDYYYYYHYYYTRDGVQKRRKISRR